MKNRNKSFKSIGIFALVLVLLVGIVLPMAAAGSSVDDVVDVYTVKKGDTLASIAANYGVTVSRIVSANGISASADLYTGQKLTIPGAASVEDDSTTSFGSSQKISVSFKDADLLGVLDTIVAHTGYTLIFKGSSQNVTIDLEDVTPLTAIDYVLRMVDMTYIKNDNVIFVSTSDVLNGTFIDNKALTRFTTKYISVDALMAQLSALGISVDVIKSDINIREFWVSAYPMELAKINELIATLDNKTNITVASASISSSIRAIEMRHLPAADFSTLLSELGLHAGITIDAHPMTLYVYASGEAYEDIIKIKKLVDYADPNAKTKVEGEEGEGGEGKSEGDVVISDGTTSLVKVELKYITKENVENIVSTFGYEVDVLGIDIREKTVWIRGEKDEVNKAVSRIKENDIAENQTTKTFFTYELQNIVASELQQKISYIDIENVEFYFGSYPEITKSIMVYCPQNKVEEVKKVIASLDNNLGKIYYPVKKLVSAADLNELAAKEELVVKFLNNPSISIDCFAVSGDLDGSDEGVEYILYVLAAPEHIDSILNMWAAIEGTATLG